MRISQHNSCLSKHVKPGNFLIEVVVATVLLIGVAFVTLRATNNVLSGRQQIVLHTLADSALLLETAKAQRISFDEMKDPSSAWKIGDVDEQEIEIGKISGGEPVKAMLARQRFADELNYPAYGGSGTLDSNPLAFEKYTLAMVLTYEVDGRKYVKTRSVVRSR